MEFGKVDHLDAVEFKFWPDDSRNQSWADKHLGGPSPFFFGLPVWNEKSWRGKLYPDTAQRDLLFYYCQKFNVVEVNSSFYHIPSDEMAHKWVEQVALNPDFQFMPKFPKKISHDNYLRHVDKDLQDFAAWAKLLGKHLGPCFLQLPQDFSTHYFADLETFLMKAHKLLPMVVEFRHHSWFADGKLRERAYGMLHHLGIGTVITDTPGMQFLSHRSLTSADCMIRFVGGENGGHKELHPSVDRRLAHWIEWMQAWQSRGIRFHFIAHMPDNVLAPELSDRFISLAPEWFPSGASLRDNEIRANTVQLELT